jgi:hypothetical protein
MSLLASIGGLLCGALLGNPTIGERGGAITVALAFLFLFVRRNYGSELQEALSKPLPSLDPNSPNQQSPEDPQVLRRDIDAIVNRLRVESSGQKAQNTVLAIVSATGTIVWGFGDLLTRWLEPWLCYLC